MSKQYSYAKGRIEESVKFVSGEMEEFSQDYQSQSWKTYQEDKKIQKLMDRTVENILTALIEICGTVLAEEGIATDNYAETLRQAGKYFDFSEEEQTQLSRLAVLRNRLAHRYLNFRWQVISTYKDQQELIQGLLRKVLRREEII